MTAAAPTTAAAIEKKIYASGKIALIISNQEMEDTTVIVKYLEESGLLNKGVSKKKKKKLKMNEKKKNKGFLIR